MSAAGRPLRFPRRDLLKAGGALLIGFHLPRGLSAQAPVGVALVLGPDQPDQADLDSWLAIHGDNTASIYFGHVELGQGCTTALLQIAAEELDLSMAQVRAMAIDTRHSPNQGGTVASAAIALGGPRVRLAAAEARAHLLRLAAAQLGRPVERLNVHDGIVQAEDNPEHRVTYAELLGEQPFEVPFTGTAAVKPVSEYRIVGTRVPRGDIPAKAAGTYRYMQQLRVPGMLHGRIIRPRGQADTATAAEIVSVDASALDNLDGVRLVRRANFLGVVAAREWDAVRAAELVRVTWARPEVLPGNDGVYASLRAAAIEERTVFEGGDPGGAVAAAAQVVSGHFFGPYQAHAPFAPNCAIADVRPDGVDIFSSTQNIFETREKIAHVIGVPVESVDVCYYEGAGTFGRSCFDDAAEAAALLSQAAGAPVRVQYMRHDEHGWDNYGPAHVAEVRAAIDADARIIAYEYDGWQHEWSVIESTEQLALGTPAEERPGPIAQEISAINLGSMYVIPNRRIVNHRVDGTRGYLKGANLRSPLDISMSFASEQVIDELGRLAGLDGYTFRRRNMTDARWIGVLDAVAEAAEWQTREWSGSSATGLLRGWGIALGTHTASYAAAVAEVEVNPASGTVGVTRLYGAIDAGLAINPAFIENQVSGMLVQAASRMLKEEVQFDTRGVTSLDWNSYPVLRFAECPDVTPIVITRPGEPASGAGEEVLGPAAAAIANAVASASGVRLHRYPLTPERVLAALAERATASA